jgi:hypothetical protein
MIGVALCLVHYLFHDYDSIYIIFYAFSVPAWFASVFMNVYDLPMWKIAVIYLLTIATWTLIGYVIDRFSVSARRRRRT